MIAKGAFLRFRFGDGFSSSRALALQGSLAVIPFLLALTGLAADIDQERPAQVVARTIEQVSPGHGTGDALARAVTGPKSSERAGEVALTLGLLLSLLSMTTAMGQVERAPTGSTASAATGARCPSTAVLRRSRRSSRCRWGSASSCWSPAGRSPTR